MSMAPTAVRMVLVEGENGDGVTVDEDNFDVAAAADAATVTASDQVVSAILGTRQGAAEGGYQLASTGVTFTDPLEAAALRDKLAAHKVENVMLVSAFLAAAALAQAVGHQTNYAQTALLYIEPDTATLAVVDSADGSIANVQRQALPDDDEAAVAQLAAMVSTAENLETRPDAVFVVGSGVDIPLIKPALEAATTLPLSAPEEPETALARGAALASAHAPLFSSSTAALAYAQDPGTGAINPLAVAPGYFENPGEVGADGLAYSAVPDDPDEFFTGSQTAATALVDAGYHGRSSFRMVGSAVAAIFVIGVVALVVSLAIAIRPTAGVRPNPNQNVVVAPTRPAPAPAAPAPVQAPAPAAPAPAPEAPAPEAVPQAPAPEPAAPAPAPAAPIPVPEAPAPAPAAPPPPPPAVAPIPVPIPLPIPGLGGPGFGGPPGGGFGPHGGGDGGPHGGGGFPGFPGGGGGHGGGGFPGFGGGHGGFGRH
ncbi:hypothetical protein B8W69_01840 [Mycobacterium vulneris]|uniref:DUF7159 domain-containing protein n=1 Tax=Mycolicibacterium vulneris TaxID=547163 RepID=A0A1X2LEZ0_9MYCO|nr:hypothetical protein B8W69_01840 [Mycolicibacterium vulneris]